MLLSRTGAPAAAMVLLAILAVGCAGRPGATASPVPATVTAPVSSVDATGEPSPEPSPTPRPPVASASAPEPEPTLEPPPAATLVAGDNRHPGEPGSWVWALATNDAPWLPARALDRASVPSGPLAVEIAGDLEVESWTARAATADDVAGATLTTLGGDSGEPAFDSPEPGAWVVAVDVLFADGLGSATYYWFLDVT